MVAVLDLGHLDGRRRAQSLAIQHKAERVLRDALVLGHCLVHLGHQRLLLQLDGDQVTAVGPDVDRDGIRFFSLVFSHCCGLFELLYVERFEKVSI